MLANPEHDAKASQPGVGLRSAASWATSGFDGSGSGLRDLGIDDGGNLARARDSGFSPLS